MNWRHVGSDPPMRTSLQLLVCTFQNNLHIVDWTEEAGFTDDYCNPIPDVTHWMYLSDVPRPPKGTITNDEWIVLVAENGLLKKS